MSGAGPRYVDIVENLSRHLGNKLAGRNCRVMGSDMKLKVPATAPYRYADLSVTCGERKFEQIGGMDVLVNPTLIIEVLSPPSERFDRTAKFALYQSIPRFKEYLLVAQDRPCITHYVKQPPNIWRPDEASNLAASLYLPSIDCTLALSEIYEGISFGD